VLNLIKETVKETTDLQVLFSNDQEVLNLHNLIGTVIIFSFIWKEQQQLHSNL
jgi:hypothetical protein